MNLQLLLYWNPWNHRVHGIITYLTIQNSKLLKSSIAKLILPGDVVIHQGNLVIVQWCVSFKPILRWRLGKICTWWFWETGSSALFWALTEYTHSVVSSVSSLNIKQDSFSLYSINSVLNICFHGFEIVIKLITLGFR